MVPKEPVRGALVRDIEKVVDSEEQIKGWVVDDAEIELVINDAMLSLCRVPPGERAAAVQWLSQEISARGGPVAEAWRKNGKDLGAVSELMLLSRTRALLEEAQRRAAAGKCPFWIEPEEDFKGRQSFRHRFLVAGEGGGRFSVGIENTGTAHAVIGLGAGGAGRILGGYGVSDDFTLLVGGEVALGGRLTAPGGVVITGTGLVSGRINFLSYYLELETGPVGYQNQLTGLQQFGAHGAIGFGTTTLRSFGGFVAGSVFSISYDYAFGSTRSNLITLGVRATYALSK
jgi:hypothetical protein